MFLFITKDENFIFVFEIIFMTEKFQINVAKNLKICDKFI